MYAERKIRPYIPFGQSYSVAPLQPLSPTGGVRRILHISDSVRSPLQELLLVSGSHELKVRRTCDENDTPAKIREKNERNERKKTKQLSDLEKNLPLRRDGGNAPALTSASRRNRRLSPRGFEQGRGVVRRSQ